MSGTAHIDFIGIGAKKAATSWLAQCLSEHPDICVPKEKELHFFSKDELFNRGFEWYVQQFAGCSDNAILGEFSTSYLSDTKCADRIHACCPDAKLIVSLRNPIERAVSHMRHWQSKHKLEHGRSVREAVESYPGILTAGEYSGILEYYFSLFGRERVHVILFDDIQDTPDAVIADVYAYLGVRTDFTPPSLHNPRNTSRQRRSRIYRLMHRTYMKLRKSTIGRMIIKGIKATGIPTRVRVAAGRDADVPSALNADDKAFLKQAYQQEIEQLETLLERDLGIWKNI
jgi:hypothetical protein